MQTSSLLENYCREFKLPTIRQHATQLSEEAARQQRSHLNYLLDLLEQEYQERLKRRSQRRIHSAHFPWLKTIESFDFNRTPEINAALIYALLTNEYIEKVEPIIFLGEPGTGKTHLAISLGIAAATQGYHVRFITTAELANQLMEAKDARHLSKTIQRYTKPGLLILDELGYLPLRQADAELLFQVLSKRHEHKPVIVTTNLPFSEWIKVFPDPRLCKAVIDRLTHKAHIIQTGLNSVRLEESVSRAKKKSKETA